MKIKTSRYDIEDPHRWLGEVVDIEDPLFEGRAKIRVFGKFDDLDPEFIPWAYPANNKMAGSESGGSMFSVPKVGSIVCVTFDNENIYHPEYHGSQKISDEVKAEIESSYENAHIIVYDTVTGGSLKVFFTEAKGLMLDYQETKINIKPDKSVQVITASGKSDVQLLDDGTLNVTQANNVNVKSDKDVNVTCKNAKITASDSIHLDCSKNASVKLGSSVTDAVILGDKFQTYFNSHTHIGVVGIPTSPPVSPMPNSTLSKVVKTQ
jgi:hypothetical protein